VLTAAAALIQEAAAENLKAKRYEEEEGGVGHLPKARMDCEEEGYSYWQVCERVEDNCVKDPAEKQAAARC
jgi:hypothetical protein